MISMAGTPFSLRPKLTLRLAWGMNGGCPVLWDAGMTPQQLPDCYFRLYPVRISAGTHFAHCFPLHSQNEELFGPILGALSDPLPRVRVQPPPKFLCQPPAPKSVIRGTTSGSLTPRQVKSCIGGSSGSRSSLLKFVRVGPTDSRTGRPQLPLAEWAVWQLWL
jgi:hypothetical protein